MKLSTIIPYLAAALLAVVVAAAQAEVTVKNIVATPRWPWNGLVDIDYLVESDDPNADVWVYPQGFDGDRNIAVAPRTLFGDGANSAPVKPGQHRMTWDARADDAKLNSSKFTVTMKVFSGASLYMVVDLSGSTGAATYPVRYSATAPDLNDDTCRTTEMWFRLILPGTFMMGSPSSELGRDAASENLHQVTLTKPFYIGVFEVTQKQYALVTGTNPSFAADDTRPVEPVNYVSYDMIRGSANGAQWPGNNQVDVTSFMGKLRTKTSLTFDLPTESQWEYACRAGTSTALNSGKDITVTSGTCPNMSEVGRYNGGPTKVGMYKPNAWGLYDMHGNVWEWCLDWYMDKPTVLIDPKGATSGSKRLLRGGNAGSYSQAFYCRSACRGGDAPTYRGGSGYNVHDILGFRAVILPASAP